MKLHIPKIREEFPILDRKIHGKPLVYFDNAATSQKPRAVIEKLTEVYTKMNANVHRGVHLLSEEATLAYEATRERIAEYLHASSYREIVFTKNCTEAINLVAHSWGEKYIGPDDEVIVSALEHHSNLVPWQELTARKGAKLRVIPLKEDFTLDYKIFKKLLKKGRSKLVCITGMSNVTGTIPDLELIIEATHKAGAKVLVDGAQALAHMKLNVKDLNVDFLTFSAHKMLGPSGVGVLYAKEQILETMTPFLYGGDMVHVVKQERATYNDLPWRFEAGTPNIADVIAFREAIDFLEKIGPSHILHHDRELLKYACEMLSQFPEVKMFVPPLEQAGGVLSFTIEGAHPHDIAAVFNEEGVAIRSGHHCAMPLHEKWLGIPASARMSFYLYNTEEEIERAEKAVREVIRIFNI